MTAHIGGLFVKFMCSLYFAVLSFCSVVKSFGSLSTSLKFQKMHDGDLYFVADAITGEEESQLMAYLDPLLSRRRYEGASIFVNQL